MCISKIILNEIEKIILCPTKKIGNFGGVAVFRGVSVSQPKIPQKYDVLSEVIHLKISLPLSCSVSSTMQDVYLR